MNPFKNPRGLLSPNLQGFAFNFGKKALACSLAYLMVPLGIGDLYAQSAPPPPDQQQQYQAPPPPDQSQDQQDQDQAPPPPDQDQDQDQGPPPEAYTALAPEQLDQMVAPIALYPDALVAQVLAASTYPTQVADADHFLQSNEGAPPDQLANMANGMDWDPSVKALIAFPTVLANLDRNLDWTTQLGNAYYNQPQDVMAAVQDMRSRAYASGNLRSNPQIAVDYQPGDIVIAPANPAVVYVPWYDPWAVYGEPIAPWGGFYVRPRPAGLFFAAGLGIGFGVGIAIASWNNYGWGWHNWGVGWHDRTVVYQRNVYISNSVHVVNHGYYGHFDRSPAARAANMNIARRAPNYRPANNNVRGGVNNNFNRTNNNARPANNNNRPAANNNFNRPNNNARPAYNSNRPANNTSRPENNARPAYNNNRPAANNNFNRPANNTSRPENNARPAYNNNRPANNVSRPENNQRPAQNYNRPQQQSRPQARQQSRPESHPSEKSNDKKEKPH